VRYTLDTGALIGLERRDIRALALIRTALANQIPLIAPTVAIAEWWRGRSDAREAILRILTIEPLDLTLSRAAGEAMARVAGSTLADTVVMASAARAGAVVLTSDFEDLERLRVHFRSVRILEV
jgi:predicted nucleic acid-binding protein